MLDRILERKKTEGMKLLVSAMCMRPMCNLTLPLCSDHEPEPEEPQLSWHERQAAVPGQFYAAVGNPFLRGLEEGGGKYRPM